MINNYFLFKFANAQQPSWTDSAFPMVKQHEGFRSNVYKDTKNKPTIGYGFNITEPHIVNVLNKQGWKKGKSLNREQANKVFDIIANSNIKELQRMYPNWDSIHDNAKKALFNMHYQMGSTKLRKFKNMNKAISNKNYKDMHTHMLDSEWARDPKLKNRVSDVSGLVKSIFTQPQNTNPNIKTYVVQPGDSLSKISENLKVPVSRLMQLNNIKNKNKISINQKLKY